jgi:hypothetical protein
MVYRHAVLTLLLTAVFLGLSSEAVGTRSVSQIRRELRRMVGYTVVASTSLQEIREGKAGERYAVLADGSVFQLQSLSLALPRSDAILFAKKASPELISRYRNLPERFQYSYKLLLEDEILDVNPVP